MLTIRAALAGLRRQHGAPPRREPTAWQLIVAENAAYLVDDERRAATVTALEDAIGIAPEALRGTSAAKLAKVIANGGMHPSRRAARLHTCAEIVLEACDGDADALLARPIAEARKLLRRFPGIGAPGADAILLRCGAAAIPAIDSNGLRVLARIGVSADRKHYAATYAAGCAALAGELGGDRKRLVAAYHLLRRHGQTVCRRTRPSCPACGLRRTCPSASA